MYFAVINTYINICIVNIRKICDIDKLSYSSADALAPRQCDMRRDSVAWSAPSW